MLIAGIVLTVLQIVVTVGAFIAGKNPFAGGVIQTIGYFLFGIIGVSLLITAAVRKKRQKHKMATAEAESVPNVQNTPATVRNSADSGAYQMDEALKAKYTKMFRQPFSKVEHEEALTIKHKKCVMYTFNIHYAHSAVGAFLRLIVVKGKTPRYFAIECSFDNTFMLCEWTFEGETKTQHLNYGEVFSVQNTAVHKNMIKILEEIL